MHQLTEQRWKSLHERLRSETRPMHDTLEAAVDVASLLVTRERYVDYLARLWCLHSGLALELEQIDFRAVGYNYQARGRVTLLERDLQIFGKRPDQSCAVSVPSVDGIPAALGCVYVLEGSALGGRAILPAISASLGLDQKTGAAFFGGYGKEEKYAWQDCLSAINRIDPHSNEANSVLASASATFALFLDWLPDTRPNTAGC